MSSPNDGASTDVQRSTFVTVLAWVSIGLSGFGTLIGIVQNIMVHTVFASAEFGRIAKSPMPGAPPFFEFMMRHIELIFLAFLVNALFLLVCSVGLLRRWNWARLCYIGYLALAIIWQFVGAGLQFTMLSSMREQFAAQASHGLPDMGAFLIAIVVVSAIMALGFSALFGWIIHKLASPPIAAEFRR